MARKAVIKKSKDYNAFNELVGEYYFFTLYSDNGQVLAHSETYSRKHNCRKVIARYFPEFEEVDSTK